MQRDILNATQQLDIWTGEFFYRPGTTATNVYDKSYKKVSTLTG